jgi:hypothetical protein
MRRVASSSPDRGSTATTKGEVHLADGVGVEGGRELWTSPLRFPLVIFENSPALPTEGSMPCRTRRSTWARVPLFRRRRCQNAAAWRIVHAPLTFLAKTDISAMDGIIP